MRHKVKNLRLFPRRISTPFYTKFFRPLFRLVFYTFLSTPRFQVRGSVVYVDIADKSRSTLRAYSVLQFSAIVCA